ncbi:MAG: FtsW/RodA/SpoVE family cell cycle protein [Lachnospiraceae bacterium]|nr:FtsW/RodA/SpoVE family cell cycle protein [Lachnospiraceae bacterium]
MSNEKRTRGGFDYQLFFVTLLLMILGIVMIYSTSTYRAGEDPYSFVKRQVLAEILGSIALFTIYFIPYSWLKFMGRAPLRYIVLGVSLGLLLLLLVPALSHTAYGATRWLNLGFFNLQPAEVVKIAVIFFVAGYISEKPERVNTLKGYLTCLAVVLFCGLMVYSISTNLSSALIIMGIGVIMLFLSCNDWKIHLLVAGIGAVGVYLFVNWIINSSMDVNNVDYHFKRIMVWHDPSAYVLDGGYQTLQALYAIGSGGITGKGIGKSVQKLSAIPEVHNDMIFSVVCEELGLVGAVVVLILFVLLLARCMMITLKAKDNFGKLLCAGVMMHIAIQVILNIAVVTNTLPNTGVSLPFISYGGSSATFLLAELGLVMKVAKE